MCCPLAVGKHLFLFSFLSCWDFQISDWMWMMASEMWFGSELNCKEKKLKSLWCVDKKRRIDEHITSTKSVSEKTQFSWTGCFSMPMWQLQQNPPTRIQTATVGDFGCRSKGSDAQVLYLWLAVLQAMDEELPETPQVIFFDSGDEFGQVKRFVAWRKHKCGRDQWDVCVDGWFFVGRKFVR